MGTDLDLSQAEQHQRWVIVTYSVLLVCSECIYSVEGKGVKSRYTSTERVEFAGFVSHAHKVAQWFSPLCLSHAVKACFVARVQTLHLSVPDWQAMFPAQNTDAFAQTRATHVHKLLETARVVFLLIADANFISGVAVRALVLFLALRCFSVLDVFEKNKKNLANLRTYSRCWL